MKRRAQQSKEEQSESYSLAKKSSLYNKPELSIILPVRNEEKALPSVLKRIKSTISKNNLSAEIIVSDSSTDNSPKIAKQHKTILVKHDKEGYGNAYLSAFPKAKGKYIILADADGTYPYEDIPKFLNELRKGNEFVIGNRFSGEMQKGAMPALHKYLGNPVLSATLRLLFKTKIRDCHCGMRGISKEALNKLPLKTKGMEFASEMIIQALKNKLSIKEIPISYTSRIGESKLSSFSDGWRHLRFMLLYSPLFLFLIPGLILSLIGFSFLITFYLTNPVIGGITLYSHPMFIASLLLIIGYQLIIFAFFGKSYAITHLGERNTFIENLYKKITIEKVALPSLILIFVGALIYLTILIQWISNGLPALEQTKNSILALTFIVLGTQTFFSSFMLSILGIKHHD
jgi:glycosyltransferase involved in cell wall biosynthesis